MSILLHSIDIEVCIADKNNDTPLHEACFNGHDKIVENLMLDLELEDPASVPVKANAKNCTLQTPLHLACREGHSEVVNCILKHIPEFDKRSILTNSRDNEENASLHLACGSGKEEIVRILVLNGADLCLFDESVYLLCLLHDMAIPLWPRLCLWKTISLIFVRTAIRRHYTMLLATTKWR